MTEVHQQRWCSRSTVRQQVPDDLIPPTARSSTGTKPEPMTIERLNELDLLALPSAGTAAEDLRAALSEALMAVWTLRELLADSRQAADTYLDQLQRAEKPDRG